MTLIMVYRGILETKKKKKLLTTFFQFIYN